MVRLLPLVLAGLRKFAGWALFFLCRGRLQEGLFNLPPAPPRGTWRWKFWYFAAFDGSASILLDFAPLFLVHLGKKKLQAATRNSTHNLTRRPPHPPPLSSAPRGSLFFCISGPLRATSLTPPTPPFPRRDLHTQTAVGVSAHTSSKQKSDAAE